MTQITYAPLSPDDPSETIVAGIKFTAHVPVNVDDVALAEKLAANPWFTDKDTATPATPPAAPPAPPAHPTRDELEQELQTIQHEIDALPKSE